VFDALKGLPTGALAGLRQADAVALDVKAAGTAILGYWTGQEANAVVIPSGIPQGHKPRPLWIANARQNVSWRSVVENHLQPGDVVLATDWQGTVCLRVRPVERGDGHQRGRRTFLMVGDPKRQRHLYRAG
jgi:hypothetical protein